MTMTLTFNIKLPLEKCSPKPKVSHRFCPYGKSHSDTSDMRVSYLISIIISSLAKWALWCYGFQYHPHSFTHFWVPQSASNVEVVI